MFNSVEIQKFIFQQLNVSFSKVFLLHMAANNQFIIRCQSGNGILTIRDMSAETTVGELKTHLSRRLHIRPDLIKILSGYPPLALIEGADHLSLSAVNIKSGETLIIQKMHPPIRTGAADGPGITVNPSAILKPAECIVDAGGAGDRSEKEDVLLQARTGIMMRHVVPSNNSCLFTSVYFVLSNGDLNREKSNELRRIIAQVVAANQDKFNDAVLQMSNRNYCLWIMNNSHWGGAIELSILSEHFGIEIVALDTSSLSVHRFGENLSYANRIFLIYDGIHYDPLVLELESGALQTIFPASDNYPLEMALEIAREARSSRQFTDVANFTLRCMQCDVRLRGDAEARRHAVDTGHVEFGEIV